MAAWARAKTEEGIALLGRRYVRVHGAREEEEEEEEEESLFRADAVN